MPLSPFGADVTAEQVTADLDLQGKRVLVTGVTSGLGLETMRVLAMRGRMFTAPAAWLHPRGVHPDKAMLYLCGLTLLSEAAPGHPWPPR